MKKAYSPKWIVDENDEAHDEKEVNQIFSFESNLRKDE